MPLQALLDNCTRSFRLKLQILIEAEIFHLLLYLLDVPVPLNKTFHLSWPFRTQIKASTWYELFIHNEASQTNYIISKPSTCNYSTFKGISTGPSICTSSYWDNLVRGNDLPLVFPPPMSAIFHTSCKTGLWKCFILISTWSKYNVTIGPQLCDGEWRRASLLTCALLHLVPRVLIFWG